MVSSPSPEACKLQQGAELAGLRRGQESGFVIEILIPVCLEGGRSAGLRTRF